GFSPVEAGLLTVPLALMTMVASPLSGRIVGGRGARLPLVAFGVCTASACTMLTGLDADTPVLQLLAAYVVFGVGFGFVNAPITNAAVSGMPRAQAGVASAIATTSRQVGQTLGVALVGAIAASHAAGPADADIAAASHLGWWALTACGGVVLALGIVATSARALASARRTAAQLNPEALAA
ncbi:MAG TPA: MFS transporter, partial [Baekduia sp.]|nr:MFS transporter [Baekduia sp.]